MCRKLVVAATCSGVIMAPGRPSVLGKMATPRRYLDKGFMRRVAPEIYGGAFRENPELIARHAAAMSGASEIGYLYQILAMTGWTSLPWLWTVQRPTFIFAGAGECASPARHKRPD